ncbi:MFF [Mytilus edulis]|uniref:Mitochondrial fission factor n=1 Tax=Mytilus edulis TaxID=6550 RepID=A0A8S3TC77_MYTED|nr:MFF [Mytilus edulis]
MTDMENASSHLNSLPSDFSDVQPKTYDPNFISEISSRMQIPDRLNAVEGAPNSRQYNYPTQMAAVSMQVPDTISLHANSPARDNLERFDFGGRGDMNYVGLITPPRTLTMEEAFPENSMTDNAEEPVQRPTHTILPNGDTRGPVMFTPGASLSDSLLITEEDDATQIYSGGEAVKTSGESRTRKPETEYQRSDSTPASHHILVCKNIFLVIQIEMIQ